MSDANREFPTFLVSSQPLTEQFADLCELRSRHYLEALPPGAAGHDGRFADRLYIRVTLKLGGLFFGRSPEVQILLRHPEISRRHCCLVSDGTHFGLQDSGSANGTYLNGRRVPGDQAVVLNSLDQIALSDSAAQVWTFLFYSPGRPPASGNMGGLEFRSDPISTDTTQHFFRDDLDLSPE